jgi:hypothetical protein
MIKYIFILFIILIIVFNGYSETNFRCNRSSEGEIRKGIEYLKTKKVAFCGLIRDGEDRLPNVISKVEKMGKYFKDWEVLIVENDSKDKTRSILLDWSNTSKKVSVLGCGGINLPECKLNMKKTLDHEVTDYRISKMATLRNIYLDELVKRKDIDLVIVWDFDLISEIDEDGLFKSGYKLSMNNEINAICANGIIKHDIIPFMSAQKVKTEIGVPLYFYYDTYAYREINDKITPLKNKYFYDFIYSNPEKCKDDKLKKVRSCFGGFTIYKKEALLKSEYGTYNDINNKAICEHEFLNEKIDGVYHSKELLHLVYKN